jgi:hypothetical protein
MNSESNEEARFGDAAEQASKAAEQAEKASDLAKQASENAQEAAEQLRGGVSEAARETPVDPPDTGGGPDPFSRGLPGEGSITPPDY